MINKRQSTFFLAILLVVVVFFTIAGCTRRDPFIRTRISGETVIDGNKKEFVFKKPYKPWKPMNKLCFIYKADLNSEVISEAPRFPDGEILSIDAVVFDQNGKIYNFKKLENSSDGYYCVVPDNVGFNEWLNIYKRDVKFVKLVLSSNRRINLTSIEWVAYHPLEV